MDLYVGELVTQVRALCWKNRLLKLRNWSTLILELVLPTAIILALLAVKDITKGDDTASSVPSGFSQILTFSEIGKLPPCWSRRPSQRQNLLWDCFKPGGDVFGEPTCPKDVFIPRFTESEIESIGCMRRIIAVAPNVVSNTAAATAAADFVAWAENSTLFSANLSTATFKLYNSEEAVLGVTMNRKYTADPSLPLISSAIIFSGAYPNWEYTIRQNMSVTVETSEPDVNINIKTNTDPKDFLGNYVNAGSLTLTNAINSFIGTQTCRLSDVCTDNEDVKLWMYGGAQFPNPKNSENGFWGAVGNSFNILMIMTLLYPISNMIKVLVTEKETKIREGMAMMSMRSDALWISWIIDFVCLLLPLSILLTIAGSSLFQYSMKGYIFLYFFVFFLASMSYAIFISIFFSKARTAAIMGSLIFFCGWFIHLGMTLTSTWALDTPKGVILFASLHPATAFCFGK